MRYPGGKGRCFQHLISLMPSHRTYIESHLGGGAVLRHKRPAQESIGIDQDPTLIARWEASHPDLARYVVADAAAFLEAYPFRGDELVYCDPPYPRATRRKAHIYRYDYTDDDHRRLLTVIRRAPCMVVVSSYANDLYAAALADWRVVAFPGDSHTGPRTEVAWLNFQPTDDLHDFRYLGADYRERERLRRRRNAIADRVARLPPLERRALLDELAGRFGAIHDRGGAQPSAIGPPRARRARPEAERGGCP